MKIEIAGIYRDFDEAEYHNDPCIAPSLNQTIAKVLIEQTALHARTEHPRFKKPDADNGEKYDKAKAIGNAAHAILIGRGKTMAVGDFDDWRKKEAQNFKEDALEKGLVPILADHMEIAHRMVQAAKLQLTNAGACDVALDKAFREGAGEVVVAAEIDGIWLRSLIDWMVNPALLFDFKSTGMSVAPHVIPNLMAEAGWHVQAAMQERILDVIDPDNAGRRRFFFIAQENYEPFALTIHEMPEGTMTMGRKMLAKAEAMWREAILTNVWSGYAPVIHRPELPAWKETRWLEREMADEARRHEKFQPQNLMAG